MSEPYIVVSDQEEDWKPVIKNFVAECALEGLIEIAHERPLLYRRHEVNKETGKIDCKESFGAAETRIYLGEKARKLGHTDVKILFSHWFNKFGYFAPNPYKKDESKPYDGPYYDPAADML